MYEVFLTKTAMSILDTSGFQSDYYIDDDEHKSILNFYKEQGLELNSEFQEVIKVFGNRTIYYSNDSIPDRKKPYEINFEIKAIWGKLKPKFYRMMEIEIHHFEKEYSLKNLIPLAIMPSGPLTFFVDKNNHIYGMIDSMVVSYKGSCLWSSLEMLFKGQSSS